MEALEVTGPYYNGLRTIEDGTALVDVVDEGGRRPLTPPDGRAAFGWFVLGSGSGNLARAILMDAGGEDALPYAEEFQTTVVIHLHGRADDRPDPDERDRVVGRRGGTTCSKQWRLPEERVRLWLLERAERGPLSSEEVEELDFSQPEEWMIEGTTVG
jgi:hypothetical protein